jgi:hypothetical protein
MIVRATGRFGWWDTVTNTSRGTTLVVASGILMGAVIAGLVISRSDQGEVPRGAAQAGSDAVYPDAWLTSLEEAKQDAVFDLLVPVGSGLSEVPQAVYVTPAGDGVALQYPLLTPSTSPTRQDFIDVWEGPWTFDISASKLFEEEVAADPDNVELATIDGVPAMVVRPHSPDDPDAANPTLVRFELDGVDVHVSGGDHTDDLLAIAKSMVQEAAGTR